MTIIARNHEDLKSALLRQGFFLVSDLPKRICIKNRRGMLVARIS